MAALVDTNVLVYRFESLVAGYLDSVLGARFDTVAPYVLLLLVLFVRPYWLSGRPQVERV